MKLVLMVGSRETTTAAEVMAHKEKNKTRVTGSTCMIGGGCVQGILAAAVMALDSRAPPQNRIGEFRLKLLETARGPQTRAAVWPVVWILFCVMAGL